MTDKGIDLNSLEWDSSQDAKFLGELGHGEEVRGGYVKVSGVVDTGAEDHAIREDTAPWIETVPSDASTNGSNFRGPAGEEIAAKGRKTFKGLTAQGQHATINGEVCNIRRSLFSAVKIADAGNDVVVSSKRAYIKNIRTEKVTWLRKQGNVWMLDLWLRLPPDSEKGFTRRGR